MKKKLPWILLIGFLSLGALFVLFATLGTMAALVNPPATDYSVEADLAIVELRGSIDQSESFLKKLRTIQKNEDLQGVIVRIDSPGGVVGASQEIHDAIKKLSQDKLVIASLASMATSGGYYAAVAAHEIVSNPGTLTGSIGVRMDHANVEKLLKFAKIEAETLKAGQLKDLGSPLRNLEPGERLFLEEVLKNLHQQFKKAVSEGRKIPLEKLETIADGRILTGEQAFELGLVDHLGNQEKAIQVAKEKLKLPEDAEIIYPELPFKKIEGLLSRVIKKVFFEIKASQENQAYY